jgi:acetolactate synthase I/III small subunit
MGDGGRGRRRLRAQVTDIGRFRGGFCHGSRKPSSLYCAIEWIGRKPLFWPPFPPDRRLKTMRHIIAIHMQNEAGALTRVTGLFSTRGYNIESLSVAATDDPSVSRVTLTTKGADSVILQIVNQLNKLIDVVAVEDLTRGEHIERELVVLKLRVEPQLIDSVRGYVVRAGGRVLEPSPEGFVVELTASEAEVNQFVTDLGERTDIVEVVRSGALAVGRNARALHVVR